MIEPVLLEVGYAYHPYNEPHPDGVHQFYFTHPVIAKTFTVWFYVEKAKEGTISLETLRQDAHVEAQRWLTDRAAKQKKHSI